MRHGRSYLLAFTKGLMLASVPVAAFFGVDYLFTPPQGDAAGRTPVGTVARMDAPARPDAAGAMPSSTNPGSDRAAAKQDPFWSNPAKAIRSLADSPSASHQVTLVSSIQQELIRVGCYAGQANGSWNDRTRLAMQAFNASVHVSLETGRPDYILLTLLQGHNGRACSRPCAEHDGGGSCIDTAIEARAVPLPAASKSAGSGTVKGEGRTTAAAVSSPITVPKAPVPSTAASATPAQTPIPIVRWNPNVRLATPTPGSIGATGQTDGAGSLPGRMGVGVQADASSEQPASLGSAGIAAHPRVRSSPNSTPMPGHQTSKAQSSSRLGRIFTDLSRNAP